MKIIASYLFIEKPEKLKAKGWEVDTYTILMIIKLSQRKICQISISMLISLHVVHKTKLISINKIAMYSQTCLNGHLELPVTC